MGRISYEGKNYEVDDNGFLADHAAWDEGFARATAPAGQVRGELGEQHWKVLHYIRDSFGRTGNCPLVYETCKANGIFLRQLKDLFPAGYLRGACKMAGITYADRFVNYFGEEGAGAGRAAPPGRAHDKSYLTNAAGYLLDHSQWDEAWAANKAAELGVRVLTRAHWKIIRFLRETFEKTGAVPTVYETCERNNCDLADLELLFPPGYQRGAVKIAGLWTR